MWLRHDSESEATLKNRQVLGSDSPLEFDEDGYAEVDDEVGERITNMHIHVEEVAAPDAADEDEGATDSEDEDTFDAEAFVDRTPMDDVIEDLESGEYDAHLDAIEAAAEREGVLDAVDERRE